MRKMSLPESHELSRKLNDRLDDLGYNTARVEKRVQDWKKMSEAKTMAAQVILKHDKIERLHVGSNGEGIALAHESDTDIAVVCVDNLERLKCDDRIIFYLDREKVPAGYAYLRLLDKGKIKSAYMSDLKPSLIGEEMFLSSEKYIFKNEDIFSRGTGYISRNTVYHPVTGPAIPKTIHDHSEAFRKWWFDSHLNEDIDFVQSFPCLCPDLLQTWSVRPRFNDWPSKEMVEQVKLLQCYVVPVGKKGSQHQDLQWRISFTPAEMNLVQSFNDTQRKVLIILRHIAKHRLKPICPDITSYIAKNVTFWVSEETPLHQFQSYLLLDRVTDALKFLWTCILKRSLQNYINPERDILQEKITLSERTQLAKEISNMIKGHDSLYSLIKEMTESKRLAVLNYIDTISTEVADLFTTERLTEFIISSGECDDHIQYTKCYHRHMTLSYIRKYKWRIPCGIIRAVIDLLHVGNLPNRSRYFAVEALIDYVPAGHISATQLRKCTYFGVSLLVLTVLLSFIPQLDLYVETLLQVFCPIVYVLCVSLLLVIVINKITMKIFECCLPDQVQRFRY